MIRAVGIAVILLAIIGTVMAAHRARAAAEVWINYTRPSLVIQPGA